MKSSLSFLWCAWRYFHLFDVWIRRSAHFGKCPAREGPADLPALSNSSPSFNAAKNSSSRSFLWCAWRDLNPHGLPLEPKSSASASSATGAGEFDFTIITTQRLRVNFTGAGFSLSFRNNLPDSAAANSSIPEHIRSSFFSVCPSVRRSPRLQPQPGPPDCQQAGISNPARTHILWMR